MYQLYRKGRRHTRKSVDDMIVANGFSAKEVLFDKNWRFMPEILNFTLADVLDIINYSIKDLERVLQLEPENIRYNLQAVKNQ